MRGEESMKNLDMNLERYEKSISESDKPVLVEFWAPWCVYCRRIAPAYDKIAEQYEDKLVVGKINVDDVPELAEKEGIEAIPALLLYKNGEVVDSIVAPDSKARMEEFIEKCSQFGEQAGMTNEQMKEYCTKLFPTLKRWQNTK